MTTFEQAVAEVKSYISGKLRNDIDLDKAAEAYVWYGIEKGSQGGEMSAEIRGTDSNTGGPIAFTFTAVDDE